MVARAVGAVSLKAAKELQEREMKMVETVEDRERFLQAQLEEVKKLINAGGNALRQGQTEAGGDALSEAMAILDMAEEETDEHRRHLARVLNELGVVHQRQGRMEESRDHHGRAAALCEAIVESDPSFAPNAAATHLNLSSVRLADDDVEGAKESGARALSFLDQAPEEDQKTGQYVALALGAHQNLSVIHARSESWEEAGAEMEAALDAAADLPVESQANYVLQVAQGCQQLSVLLFGADKHEEALKWGRKAEELSEQGYEALGPQALQVYVISELNLISYQEKLGNFADAEDSLWKALDVAGKDPRIVLRGLAFYETCRKQADPRLEAGNLPREEVDAGLKEIEEIVESLGGVEKLRAEVDRLQRSAPASR